MDFFIKRIYASEYWKLCLKHNCHPYEYTMDWYTLDEFRARWINNPFTNSTVFSELLTKTVRTRYTLQRLLRRYKKKDKLEVCNKFDFSMSLISETKPSLLFHVQEGSKTYGFTVTDMFNIIKQALTHNIEIHPSPRRVLNPYTRTPFRQETLYLFFLKVHESTYLMPVLFYNFVKAGLDPQTFLLQNDCLLREYAIKSTVDNLTPAVMHAEIRDMLNTIRIFDVVSASYKTILPNVSLLPGTAVKQFKPWLYTYYVHQFSLSPTLREKSYEKLIQSIILFIRENPEFGSVKKGVVRAKVVSPVKIKLPPL